MIDLPDEVMTNISSFLVGTPQHLRLHNNKALRRFQKKCTPRIERDCRVDYDSDDDTLYEHQKSNVYPKFKNKSYALNLILEQRERIETIIKQSHLRYIQPDMNFQVVMSIDCIVEDENGGNVLETYCTECIYRSDEDNDIILTLYQFHQELFEKWVNVYEQRDYDEDDYKPWIMWMCESSMDCESKH